MKIWTLNNTDDEYDYIQFNNFDKMYQKRMYEGAFRGRSLIHEWEEEEIIVTERKKKADAPYCAPDVPVFSRKAINVLTDLMDSSVELLPVIHPRYTGDYQLYAVNVTDVRDCIDHSKAERMIFSTGKKGGFAKYAFKVELVKDVHIFKIKDLPLRPFFSDEFKERALSHELENFHFKEVWDSQREWMFTESGDTTVVTYNKVLHEGMPILFVLHAEDGRWHFQNSYDIDFKDVAFPSLYTIVQLDSSLLEISDLPVGWIAYRENINGVWRKEKP